MTSQPKLLAAVVAAILAAGVVGAVLVTRDKQAEAASDPMSPDGPGPGGASADGISAGGGANADANGDGTAVAPADPAGAPADGSHTPGSVSPWRAPKPGTYRTHTSRSGAGAYDADGTMSVAAAGPIGYSQARGQGATETTQSYAVDRGVLRQTGFTVSSQTGTATCTWSTPLTVLPAKLDAGQTWTSKAGCRLPLRDGDADLTVEFAWTIVGARESKVGDATVLLLRVDGTSKTETKSRHGTIVKTSSIVSYFDTARGLLAQSTEDATETAADGTATTYRVVETMLTVEPEESKQ